MRKLSVITAIVLVLLPIHLLAASVNFATGSIKQNIDLFELNSAGLPSPFALLFESITWYEGSMGKSWDHTFDLFLRVSRDGSGRNLIQRNLFHQDYLYVVKDGKYEPAEPWNHSTLVKEKKGTYIIKRDGLTYYYDTDKILTAIVDSSGAKTTFSSTNGKLTRITTPQNKIITFDYGEGGRLARVNDPAGKVYTCSYDDNGFLAVITFPDKSTWRFTYDPSGDMLTKTDRQEHTTTYTYDSLHRVLTAINHEGKIDTVTYPDNRDLIRTSTLSRDGEVTDLTYDTTNGKVTKEVDPKGAVSTYTHDEAGNVTSKTDTGGRTTSYTYDGQGHMTSMRDPDGNVTTYAYDTKGNLISITDPLQGTVRYEYDAKGRMTKTVGPDGKAFSYVYDAKGNLNALIGPNGEKIQAPQGD